MDDTKVDAINQWPTPQSPKDLRSFLGLAGYYRRFIERFAHRVAPMSDLLKTAVQWKWSTAQEEAFQDIKAAMTTAPVLAVPNPMLPYEVYTDASGFGIGAVLLQDQGRGLQPCAYISHKLTDAERNYATHEQELLAIIHALKIWRPYLEGTHFKVNSDHKALEVLATQPKLSRRQASWVEFLQAYDCKVKYIEGAGNHADALSRRPDLVTAEVHCQEAVWDAPTGSTLQQEPNKDHPQLVNGVSVLEPDDSFKQLVQGQMAGDGYHKRNRFLREEGGMAYLGRLLYVPSSLRTHLMQEAHRPSYQGHLSVDKTCAAIKRRFWWPHLRKAVRRYIGRCTECQRNKPRTHQAYGELHPIPPPERPWQQMTMDLITGLRKSSKGFDSIMVFVDRLTKTIRCVPTNKKIGAQATARLFKETIFRNYGLPEVIIADRDPRWNSLFWRSVFQSLGTHTRLSTAYHPQTDGQTERANRTLEEMLRAYITPLGDEWDQRLAEVEFAYNNSEHKSTGQTPFYLSYGFHPRVPLDLYNPEATEETPAAKDFVKRLVEGHQAAAAAIEYAGLQQKEAYDKRRMPSPFKAGDWVTLAGDKYRFQGQKDKLTRRFLGPFEIETISGNGLAATLKLPSSVRIHRTINVSRLKLWKGDKDENGVPTNLPADLPEITDAQEDEEDAPKDAPLKIETVIAVRDVQRAKPPHKTFRQEYLVQWQQHGPEDNTWVAQSALGEDAARWKAMAEAGYLDDAPAVRKAK